MACHLPVKLEHKAQWVIKFINVERKSRWKKEVLKLDKMEEIRLRAYENAVIYERTKKYLEKNLVKRELQIGNNVLLYKSRLRLFPGKLEYIWSGPFIFNKVFVNGVVEIQDTRDSHTFIVNDKRLKIYSGGEIPTKKVSLILS